MSERIKTIIDNTLEQRREERREAAEYMKMKRRSGDRGFSWEDVNIEAYLANEHERKENEWGTDYPGVEIDQNNGKTPSSFEFLRETQGRAGGSLHVNTRRFLALPRRVVDEIVEASHGGLTWGDSVRMEIPIVSYLSGLAVEQPGGERQIEYEHGETAVVPEGQIVVSKLKVARALYERFYFCPTARDAINSDKSFTPFYKSVQRAFDRLTDSPVLEHHGPAIETGSKTSDAFGQRYSVNTPGLHSLPLGSCPPAMSMAKKQRSPASFYVDTFAYGLDEDREIVDVPALFDCLVREHTGQWSTFTEQAAKSTTASKDPAENFRTKERGVEGFGWQRRQARPSTVNRKDGQENSRHVTTGAYKPGYSTHKERSRLPCAIPFVVLEIDGQTPQVCLAYARRIAEWLGSIGVPLGSVTVTYTGNQSFHVRLPAGLLGKPIFRSTRKATSTIRELYSIVEGQIDQVGDAHLDPALASPLHHIRAIGSVHEGLYSKTGQTRYCVGFTAATIMDYDLNAIQEFSTRYHDGYTLPRPGEAPAHQGLCDLLREAHERSQAISQTDGDRSSSAGIFDKIYRGGVEKGEEFAPGSVGRNLAACIVSLNLVQSGCSMQDAWLAVRHWNQKNSPPLGEAHDDDADELRYVFERAEEHAPRL